MNNAVAVGNRQGVAMGARASGRLKVKTVLGSGEDRQTGTKVHTDPPADKNDDENLPDDPLTGSLAFPSYWPPELIPTLTEKWKEICSSQVFNGDLLELDFLTYVDNRKVALLYDAQRRLIKNGSSSEFKRLVKTREQRDKSFIFFKENISLAELNSRTDLYAKVYTGSGRGVNVTWRGLAGYKQWVKGLYDV